MRGGSFLRNVARHPRSRMSDRGIDDLNFAVAWEDGRIGIVDLRAPYTGSPIRASRELHARAGAGWITEYQAADGSWATSTLDHSLGPVRWD